MLPSILITGGTAKMREQKAREIAFALLKKPLENNPDFLILNHDQAILIQDVRELQKRLQLKPYQSDFSVALILEGQRLTIPAQNCLLKTLEEPPPPANIIITAPSSALLLSTIVSRCQHLHLRGLTSAEVKPQIVSSGPILKKILDASAGERILLSQKYIVDKQMATDFILRQIDLLRGLALHPETASLGLEQVGQILRLLQQSLLFLSANVNPKLVIENLLLSYPKRDKIKKTA